MFRRIALPVVLLATVFLATPRGAQAPAEPRSRFAPTARQQGQCLAFGETRSATFERTGALRFIGTDAGRPVPHPTPGGGRTPEGSARSYLETCGSLFGIRDHQSELGLMRSERQDNGRSHVRFQQYSQGVPVFGGELIVNMEADESIVSSGGRILPDPAVDITPRVAAADAQSAAIAITASDHDVDPAVLYTTTPELWIYSPTLVGPDDGPAMLVWRMEVLPRALLPIRELVLVHAQRGTVALHFTEVDTALSRLTYTANHTTYLPGTLLCTEAVTCPSSDPHAVAAHQYAADTYNFYLAMHGRNGINNGGMTIVSTVHYGSAYANANWNGTQMIYGDAYGYPLADDVVGHELTHGVTQYTSGLYYYYQSGAINESFSDLWGEFVDQTNGAGNDAPAVKWLIGEDVAGQGALRNMANPPAFGQPDRMKSPYYYVNIGDYGGVHTNSGVNNKAAYLMVDGGTFNGQSIAPLGLTKVAKIYYEVQTHLLVADSDYADLATALYQGCNNLVGTSGILASDCQEVQKATIAVEMNLPPGLGVATAPVCTNGVTPQYLFYDDLESWMGNYSFTASTGSNRWLYDATGQHAYSGKGALFGNGVTTTITDSSVYSVAGIYLPPNAYLHFLHDYEFEIGSYDGGVVEYSTDFGATWTDLRPLIDYGAYNGTISTDWRNPLAGRPGFVNSSNGYTSTRASLASLVDKPVRFRWRMGFDYIGTSVGWSLDDIKIYTCTLPGPPTIAAIAPQAMNEDTTLKVSVQISDPDVPPSSLYVDATSSDQNVVANSGLAATGTGGTRTLSITPKADASGTTTITVTVHDGGESASTSFLLTVVPVNDPPTASLMPDTLIRASDGTVHIPFAVADVDTPLASLTFKVTTSNAAIVPAATASVIGSGTNRELVVTPIGNLSGYATPVRLRVRPRKRLHAAVWDHVGLHHLRRQ